MRWWANFFFHTREGFGIILVLFGLSFVHLNPGVLKASIDQLVLELQPVVSQILVIAIMLYGFKLIVRGGK